MDINQMIIEEENKLKDIMYNMNYIHEEISKLDKQGVDLTAQANMTVGKIEALKEVKSKMEGDKEDEQ